MSIWILLKIINVVVDATGVWSAQRNGVAVRLVVAFTVALWRTTCSNACDTTFRAAILRAVYMMKKLAD